MLTLKELEEPALNPGQELPGIFLDKEIGKGQVTVLVPAYNEARSIADTIQSLRPGARDHCY
jgi:hypothetical protein